MGLSANVYAWNALGHMIIANIAYQHVTPSVRAKLDKMVSVFAQENPQDSSLTKMATWPDAIRGEKVELFTHWHYIDIATSSDGTPLKNLEDTDNAVWAVNTIKPAIKSLHANPFDQARFLAFLIHIVGDLHQPLHTTSRISAAHPDGDRGGNLFTVRRGEGSGASVSLHKLWDDGAGFLTGGESDTNVDAMARSITNVYQEQSFDLKATDLDPANWAKEGLNLANTAVYATAENQVPSAIYIESEKKIVQQQLALAGYRLANLLNFLLSDKEDIH
jgi:hypothetical protein